jgi:thiol-disulfide isomerase/thioredoxin
LRIPQAQASAGAIEVTLSPAQPITGQVVNAAGNAVADARVSVHTIGDERLLDLVSARTDAQGRFRIDGGELRMVADVLGGESTAPVRNITLASGVDNLIKLASRVMVRGTVTDALTHQPIAKGRILLSYNSPQRPIWQRQSPRAFSHGRYQMSLSESGPAYLLKFEADGYVPQISRPIARDEGEITYDVKLVPGTGPAGIVRTPDGKPAEGAAIIAADNNTQVVMKDGKFTDQTMTTVLRTGPDGRFGFQPQINDQYTLIATHESGFRMVAASDFAAMGGDLTLQSWATVQGEVRVNGEPAGGSRVDAMAIDPLLRSVPGRIIDIESEGTADDQGRFELRVAPMQTMVGRVVRVGEMSYSYAAQARISPTPGATVRLNLGSGGRRVIGKVIVPDALAARGTWTSRFPTLAEKKDPPKAAVPENTDQMTPEQRVAWHNQWLNTDAGRAFKKAVDDYNDRRSYPVVVEADGSFYADDVEPGEYELKVPIANRSSATSIAEPFAAAEAVFIVPPPNAADAGKPLELSPIPATPIQTVRIGQMAPLFEIATLDGKQFKLEDYRGKFVVIDFWATWCAPCLEEMPAIKLVYDRFGMDDRFVMISLSLDEKVERAQEYVAKEKLGWIHGFVGPWKEMGQSKILDDYAVGGIPSAWLIGPDGRVIAKNVRGEQLTDLLSNHLPPVR